MTIVEWTDKYMRQFSLSSFQRKGTSSFQWALKRFTDWTGNIPIENLRAEMVIDYMGHLSQQGLKTGTQSQYMSAIRSFIRYLETMDVAPFKFSKLPTIRIRDRVSHPPITPEQMQLIINEIPPLTPVNIRDRAALLLIYESGMRINEALAINITELEVEAGRVRIRTEKRAEHYRNVYWRDKTSEALAQWLDIREYVLRMRGDSSPALFINLSTNHVGIRLDDAGLQRSFRLVRNRLGLPSDLVVHSLRHGCAKELERKGMPIKKIADVLGHAKISTTQIYLQSNDAETEEAYRKAHSCDRVEKVYGTSNKEEIRIHKSRVETHERSREVRSYAATPALSPRPSSSHRTFFKNARSSIADVAATEGG